MFAPKHARMRLRVAQLHDRIDEPRRRKSVPIMAPVREKSAPSLK
jgi:hypothetical protein